MRSIVFTKCEEEKEENGSFSILQKSSNCQESLVHRWLAGFRACSFQGNLLSLPQKHSTQMGPLL